MKANSIHQASASQKILRERSPQAAASHAATPIIHGIHYLGLVVEPDDLLIKSLGPVARAILPVGDTEGDDHDAVA